MSDPFDIDAWQRSVILRNAEKDPHYAPYCMRCAGLVRMRVVERNHWRCRCGAQCDYRRDLPEVAQLSSLVRIGE